MLHSLTLICVAGALTLAIPAAASPTGPAPSARVVLTNHGPVISGTTTWRPGPVRIAAASRLPDQEVTLLHFRPGYSYEDFVADGKKAQGRNAAARAAVAHVFAHTIFEGGIDLFRGQSASFTATVKAGTYYLGEMTTRPQLTAIRVTGARSRAAARSTATIVATDNGYHVTGKLTANGTITFANTSSGPQRLNLIPVKPRTTLAQVIAYTRKTGGRDNAPPPPFALNTPQIGTADLSTGRRMQLTYRLPAGTYVAADFDQDMRTGRSEALEGLAAVVILH